MDGRVRRRLLHFCSIRLCVVVVHCGRLCNGSQGKCLILFILPVASVNGVQVVAGSNPVAPTRKSQEIELLDGRQVSAFFFENDECVSFVSLLGTHLVRGVDQIFQFGLAVMSGNTARLMPEEVLSILE